MKKVAIQGGYGAYHEIAARNYFKGENLEIVPCNTFQDIFVKANNDNDTIGIMAIENTIVGGLLPNNNLLKENNLKIAGEYKLRITHSLAAIPGQSIDDIREVMSHPMALMQCEDFLDKLHNVKIVEHEDTALAAKEIADKKLFGYAAICNSLAAEMYGLEILATGIETNKRNFTRFLILASEDKLTKIQKDKIINKSSLVFVLPNKEGSLSEVLSIFSSHGINLTRIQSLPIAGREWEYQFYIDLTFTDYERYKQSIEDIIPLMTELKILGEYSQGEQNTDKI